MALSYLAEPGAYLYGQIASRVVRTVAVCGSVLAVLAPVAGGAPAPSGATMALGQCSNESVPFAGKRIAVRFVTHFVSCDTVHRLVRTYFQDIATKTCRGHGTTCIFEYAGPWDCSSPPPSFSLSASRPFAECDRRRPPASITVYRVARTPPPSASGVPVFGSSFFRSVGFGQAHPANISYGGADALFKMANIHWTNWGAAQTTGFGTGWYVPPDAQSNSQGHPEREEIAAFDLGTCKGKRAYLQMKWWFPAHRNRATVKPNSICGL